MASEGDAEHRFDLDLLGFLLDLQLNQIAPGARANDLGSVVCGEDAVRRWRVDAEKTIHLGLERGKILAVPTVDQ